MERELCLLCDALQSGPFLKPVNAKEVTDYYKFIKEPMDLQTIREVRSLQELAGLGLMPPLGSGFRIDHVGI